jgi:hypothetical protein
MLRIDQSSASIWLRVIFSLNPVFPIDLAPPVNCSIKYWASRSE